MNCLGGRRHSPQIDTVVAEPGGRRGVTVLDFGNPRHNNEMNLEKRIMRRPFRGVIRTGVIAGIVGTTAMDLVWYARYRNGGGDVSFVDWEFRSKIDGFDEAPAPAKVGKILASKANIELRDSAAPITNNVVHWSTGLTWGVVAAVLQRLPRAGAIRSGVLTGVTAFGTSYAVLPKLGVYKSITEYDTKTLWKDLSAHLVFGSAMGVATLASSGVRRATERLGS